MVAWAKHRVPGRSVATYTASVDGVEFVARKGRDWFVVDSAAGGRARGELLRKGVWLVQCKGSGPVVYEASREVALGLAVEGMLAK